jgi:DNA-3-methyladenine glycosylase
LNIDRKDTRQEKDFFTRDVLDIAENILGCRLIRKIDGKKMGFLITEVEAYRGEEDLACHARRGKTPRTMTMYEKGGILYVYLIYGIHWMLNIVTGESEEPQALLIRGLSGIEGPGRLTKKLEIDQSFNGVDITESDEIWVENNFIPNKVINSYPRIGVEYAGDYYSKIPWRFVLRK